MNGLLLVSDGWIYSRNVLNCAFSLADARWYPFLDYSVIRISHSNVDHDDISHQSLQLTDIEINMGSVIVRYRKL